MDKERIKKLMHVALATPWYFDQCATEEERNNVELMIMCASQKGIRPRFTCYVGPEVQDNFAFISSLIINATAHDFDFYGISLESVEGSVMRYGESIGKNVRTNPAFWDLLNAKIMSLEINENYSLPLFDSEKELKCAQMSDAKLR